MITGTFIPGVLDISSPLVTVGRRQVRSAGYATVQDVLKEVTSVSGGAPGEDNNTGNFGQGVGVSLRGLGAAATLVLVNSRRQPFSGVLGDFVDVSNIPAAMVERIEILPDGASALYGSDAVADVVNIILRSSVQGGEVFGRVGSARQGAFERLASADVWRRLGRWVCHSWISVHRIGLVWRRGTAATPPTRTRRRWGQGLSLEPQRTGKHLQPIHPETRVWDSGKSRRSPSSRSTSSSSTINLQN